MTDLSERRKESVHRSGFVSIVGPANAGKSTLLNAFVGRKISIVSPKAQTTRNRIVGISTEPQSQIVFVDTPGFLAGRSKGELSRFLSGALREGIEGTDAVLLVIDGKKFADDYELIPRLRSSLSSRNIALPNVIAINKIDSFERPALLPLMAALVECFSGPEGGAEARTPELVPVSAKSGKGLGELRKLISSLLPEGPQLYPPDTASDQAEEFFVAEIIREKLFYQLNQELPYSTAVVIERWQEQGDDLRINAAILVERDSQKGIVIGAGGSRLKAVGIAARTELEKRFQCRVHLELFVKVEPHWTRTAVGLRRAGYSS